MPALDRFLADNLAAAFAVLVALVAMLMIVVVVQGVRLRRAVRSYRDLVRDGRGDSSLHELLAAHADQIVKAGERMRDIEAVHELLSSRTERSVQHVGLVRFNPFEDTGSDQSFAIALLDDRRDGVIISSLHARANTRVYAKRIVGGTSTHQLSDEETDALRAALDGASRSQAAR